jgi:hypothetical protein
MLHDGPFLELDGDVVKAHGLAAISVMLAAFTRGLPLEQPREVTKKPCVQGDTPNASLRRLHITAVMSDEFLRMREENSSCSCR